MVESVRVSSWVCALIALAVAVSGCGGDDDDDAAGASGKGGGAAGSSGKGTAGSAGDSGFGTDPKRNEVTAGTICDRVATILCAGEALCCDSPGRAVADCKTAMLKTCTNTYMLDAIAKDARVGFNASGASMAVTMLEDRAKDCDPEVAAWAASAAGFGKALDGTLAAGTDCEPMGGAMTASQVELLTALASCKTSANLACLGTATEWKCTVRAAKGGKCSIDANCVDGLYCESMTGDFDGSGTCSDRKAAQAACTDDTQCTSFICTSGKCAGDDDVQGAYCLQ